MKPPSRFLISLFEQAVQNAQPRYCLPPHLPPPAKGRNVVLGAGKASAEMAKVLEDHWLGSLEGLVVKNCRRTAAQIPHSTRVNSQDY